MRIYTCYTDTHKHLFDNYFVPSLPKDVPYVSEYFPQECETGNFHAKGWVKTMKRKVDYIIDTINQKNEEWFIYSDCDIQFFDHKNEMMKDLESRLQNYQIIGMDDNMMCAGFCAMKCNGVVKNLWETVSKNLHLFPGDQLALNNYIHELHVAHAKLPRFKYFNYMHTIGRDKVWNGNDIIEISRKNLDSIIVHHANYTISVENKTKMMEIIKNAKNQNIQTPAQMGT